MDSLVEQVIVVLPAFQFPSWYNTIDGEEYEVEVLPAFQFPSWYNRYRAISHTD